MSIPHLYFVDAVEPSILPPIEDVVDWVGRVSIVKVYVELRDCSLSYQCHNWQSKSGAMPPSEELLMKLPTSITNFTSSRV